MFASLLGIKDLLLKVFWVLMLVFGAGGNFDYWIIVDLFGEVVVIIALVAKIALCRNVGKNLMFLHYFVPLVFITVDYFPKV